MEFQQRHRGVPVEGANVFFRINHGNLVQFGTDRVAEVRIDVTAAVTRDDALALALGQAGIQAEAIAETLDRGTLRILPTLGAGETPGEPHAGPVGTGTSIGWCGSSASG